MRLPRLELPAEPPPVARWEWFVVLAATLLGGFLRFVALESIPPGLWYDEAINGIDALSILREPGWPLFFVTRGHPREPMFMYLELLGILAGGTTAPALRAVGGVVGTLAIPATWWMARSYAGPRVALLTLAFFVPMRWHLTFSRLAFRTILTTLFCPLIAVFLLRTLRSGRRWDAAVLGLLCGLGLYTYLSMRLFLLAVALGLVIGLATAVRTPARRAVHLVLIAATVGLLVLVPLGLHFLSHPEHLSGRQRQISLIDQGAEGWKRIGRQAIDVALMTTLRGDHEAKHNIPGPPRFMQAYLFAPDSADSHARWRDARRMGEAPDPHGTGLPAFDLLTGLFCLGGIGLLVGQVRHRQWAGLFLLLWLLLGSLASVLSFGAPNMLRLMLLTPLAALCLALAANAILEHSGRSRRMAQVGIAILLVWFAAGETWRAFAVWPRHPQVWESYQARFRDVADWLVAHPMRAPVIVAPSYFVADTPTFIFLTDGVPGLVSDAIKPAPAFPDTVWVLAPHAPFPPVRFHAPTGSRAPVEVARFHDLDGAVWLSVLEYNEPAGD
ncbi:MAG: glycosyltransferase family 39 protein [Candidatus Sumerlaeia bacterium]|nr:glycosyltransferase family 39 protein [Candidatus Sumerlaeia bacterium]